MNVDRRAQPDHVAHARGEPGHGAQDLARGNVALRGPNALDLPGLDIDAEYLGLLMDLDAALVGAAPVAPGNGVMSGDRAGRMVEGPHDRRVTAAAQIHMRTGLADGVGANQFAVDAEVLVDLGTPAHGPHRGIGMSKREVPARGVEEVEVEVLSEVLPQAHRLVVEGNALGREVVRPDDRGVAPGVAAAEIAAVEHRDIRHPVVACKIVGTCKAMPAGTDDDRVVSVREPIRLAEHAGFGMLRREREAEQLVRHWLAIRSVGALEMFL